MKKLQIKQVLSARKINEKKKAKQNFNLENKNLKTIHKNGNKSGIN